MKIGIIGGSGLEKLNLFSNTEEISRETPFGTPSSTLFKGMYRDHEVFILSRHGRDHTIPPTQVNNRANMDAFRQLGVDCLFATTACGSLRYEIRRGEIVIPDQFIDFTRHRISTFHESFEPGHLVHSAMADPFSGKLRELLISAAREQKLSYHPKGTLITIEGPRFSTRAESYMFRIFGADIINMSIAPEAALAVEAGIPYAVIALCTDYDSWIPNEKPVSWEEVLKVFEKNVRNVTALLLSVLDKM